LTGLKLRQAGFTLVELVIVMALVAIVASIGVGRLGDNTPYERPPLLQRGGGLCRFRAALCDRAAAQRLGQARRHRRYGITLCLDSGCAATIESGPRPGRCRHRTQRNQRSATDASLLCLDTKGQPSTRSELAERCRPPAAPWPRCAVKANGSTMFTVTLEAETGAVRIQSS
jgi:prepilin-type N-terminal cleavage/methylation domain-containing protein